MLLRLFQARHFVPICLGIALLVRLIWIALQPVAPTSDFHWYYAQGLRIAAGHGYSVNDNRIPLRDTSTQLQTIRARIPTAFWPVGYPAFLGATFFVGRGIASPLRLGQLANCALYLGAMWLGYLLARRLFARESAGRGALAAMALYPNHLAYTSLLSSEILFLLLLLLGIWGCLRAAQTHRVWPWLAVGMVLGLATLTKPQAVLLPLILLPVALWPDRKRLCLAAALVWAALAIALLPWTLRNYRAFGRFVFVSNNGGINLWIGNNPDANGGYQWSRRLENLRLDRFRERSEVERDRVARQGALRYARAHPGHVLSLLPRKFLALYVADIDGLGWNAASTVGIQNPLFWRVARILGQLAYLGAWLLGAAAMLHLWRTRAPLWPLGPALIVFFTLIYLPFFGGSRFHFPVVGLLLIWAGGMVARGGRVL